jgi:hypothetical protein
MSDFASIQSPIVVPERTSSDKPVATLLAKRKTRTPWTTQVRGDASNNTIPPCYVLRNTATNTITLLFDIGRQTIYQSP